jgi:hypothetical protein
LIGVHSNRRETLILVRKPQLKFTKEIEIDCNSPWIPELGSENQD